MKATRSRQSANIPAQASKESTGATQVGTTGPAAVTSTAVTRLLVVLRLSLGFVFAWAFVDKLFGFGYATPSEAAWINGGSPTEGFLGGVEFGPLDSMFNSWAGAAWADWLFMIGLAAIGVALLAGIAMRIAAVSGAVMLVLMWAAAWPMTNAESNNPFMDDHLVYALVLIVLAVANVGATWGLGKVWAQLPVVRRFPWLR